MRRAVAAIVGWIARAVRGGNRPPEQSVSRAALAAGQLAATPEPTPAPSGSSQTTEPSDLPPEDLRRLAKQALQWANQPFNGLMPTGRQLLRRNAINLEKIAAAKELRYARQNRHPEHPTLQ